MLTEIACRRRDRFGPLRHRKLHGEVSSPQKVDMQRAQKFELVVKVILVLRRLQDPGEDAASDIAVAFS